jgi:hypothetical protein
LSSFFQYLLTFSCVTKGSVLMSHFCSEWL